MTTENLPIEKDSMPFLIMDKLDDQLIISELEGRLPEILTYHFTDKGKEVWGLSKAGVDEATGELAKQGEVIREMEMSFVDNENEAYFQVKAGRFAISKDGKEVMLDWKFGTKRQPKKYQNGNDNPFWYEQGSMKASRNASMRLIPIHIKQAVIEYAKNKGKFKEINQEDIVEKIDPAESEKLTASYIDELGKSENTETLKAVWKKVYKNKQNLLPEHFQTLEDMKNNLKNKL